MRIPITWIVVAILTVALSVLTIAYRVQGDELNRTTANQNNLLDSVTILTLKKSEFKANFEEQKKLADSLKISIGRIESVTIVKFKTKTEIKTIFKDSIQYITGDTLKCMQFATPNLIISGCIDKNNVFEGFNQYRDKMTQFIDREPKFRLFGINFGTKGIRQTIVFENKDTNIDYQAYIEFKK